MQSLWCPSTIDSKTEISSHTERGEEIIEGQVTWKLTSAFHLLSILWSSLLLPLPSLFLSALFFLSPALDLVLDLRSLSTLSLHLFPLAFSPSFAAMVTTSSLHEVHLQRTGGRGGGRDARVI